MRTLLFSVLLMAGAVRADLLLTADHLLDIRSGRLVDNAAVLIRDGRIVAAGSRDSIDAPADVRRVHLSGETLLPGLIDKHVHLTSSPDYPAYKGLALSETRQAIQGVLHAKRTLYAGFTTVRNVGAKGYGDIALRDAIRAGEVPGPRLFVSGPPVGITGGHCSDNNLLPPEYNATREGVADGPWAVR